MQAIQRRRVRTGLLLGTLLTAIAAPLAPLGRAVAAPVAGTDVTYTLDGQFDQGSLVDVNHDAPNSDQLQLDKVSTFFPFVNIAASQRGTAIRIDVNTGQITGEYRTAPDGMGRDPSRTTVDKFGNVWVANRAESSGGQGSVARIGLVTGERAPTPTEVPTPQGSTSSHRSRTTRVRTATATGCSRPRQA